MEPLEGIGCQDLLKEKPKWHGHVMKESKNLITPVVQRYLILHKGCLYYYKDFNKTSPSGTLSLTGYQAAKAITWRNQPWPFIVRSLQDIEKRALMFACSSEEEQKNWIKCINAEASPGSNQDQSYDYACETVGRLPTSEPAQDTFDLDPLTESFNGPSIFPSSTKFSHSPKPPIPSRKSSGDIRRTTSNTLDASYDDKAMPFKPNPPPRPQHSSGIPKPNQERRSKGYELPPEKLPPALPSRSRESVTSEGIVELLTSRGVPDGETSPISVYESADSELLPSSCFQFGLSRLQSESSLKDGQTRGMYLIRKDRNKTTQVLSVFFGEEVYHYKIFGESTDTFHLDKKHPSFDSLSNLIHYYHSEYLPTVDNCLKTPYNK